MEHTVAVWTDEQALTHGPPGPLVGVSAGRNVDAIEIDAIGREAVDSREVPVRAADISACIDQAALVVR
jgi:hypothetical protein